MFAYKTGKPCLNSTVLLWLKIRATSNYSPLKASLLHGDTEEINLIFFINLFASVSPCSKSGEIRLNAMDPPPP
ncbi:hypothetical protein A3D05_03245 [Candidatus Gottesmanbacteria bacterium RIFCSPHIGHO2_02_FULL_40_24]|uniref:Uncharacterized protein n=1 Tax=Candidatus Gottesmanbacteria bacterium RIFCSPHIGHO2_01_FULL_40_15 TaxID=1798376 RepID=A0A1F5Z1B2_9BACT|nr:MAG: hypothetical protein A2777_04825 [Candidatus Gottesmanbacteria bacterium RIFCSPHIGHO2_01_FULL_40_15]OGG17707.1 MAG: hypothetical protein A3D05_03245 [Candidatus Gottesmanbacteria bacterium RIFCSPHIGHO2_02_FULL_40_24]OGG24814.1 MAG: hypothetical protein A3E42_02475 [Candidatus Gottesmanbacteria bacterium RIFCSPHIGHO2_12_FULL_40_13]OGG33095.1 MAG: hypothetical protein A3I80_01800 [Candidatus Gottesmanbacteria bacterium RIFCSPLOWO2_02_FULL_40_10]